MYGSTIHKMIYEAYRLDWEVPAWLSCLAFLLFLPFLERPRSADLG